MDFGGRDESRTTQSGSPRTGSWFAARARPRGGRLWSWPGRQAASARRGIPRARAGHGHSSAVRAVRGRSARRSGRAEREPGTGPEARAFEGQRRSRAKSRSVEPSNPHQTHQPTERVQFGRGVTAGLDPTGLALDQAEPPASLPAIEHRLPYRKLTEPSTEPVEVADRGFLSNGRKRNLLHHLIGRVSVPNPGQHRQPQGPPMSRQCRPPVELDQWTFGARVIARRFSHGNGHCCRNAPGLAGSS